MQLETLAGVRVTKTKFFETSFSDFILNPSHRLNDVQVKGPAVNGPVHLEQPFALISIVSTVVVILTDASDINGSGRSQNSKNYRESCQVQISHTRQLCFWPNAVRQT